MFINGFDLNTVSATGHEWGFVFQCDKCLAVGSRHTIEKHVYEECDDRTYIAPLDKRGWPYNVKDIDPLKYPDVTISTVEPLFSTVIYSYLTSFINTIYRFLKKEICNHIY